MTVILGAAAGAACLAIALLDTLRSGRWGLPSWRPAPRWRCGVPGCGARFSLSRGPAAAVAALEMHGRAAHDTVGAPVLWPVDRHPLPWARGEGAPAAPRLRVVGGYRVRA